MQPYIQLFFIQWVAVTVKLSGRVGRNGNIIIDSCAHLSVNHCISTLNNRLRAPRVDLYLLLNIAFLWLKCNLLFEYALCDGGRGTGGK